MEVEQVTDQGKQLLAFVQDVRKFCTQLADLLGTADKLMAADGWEGATAQKIAFAYSSSSLDKPDHWFPREVFRFYRQAENPRVLAMVSALLDNDRKGEYKLTEPLLCAGWLEFAGDAPEVVPSDLLWWSRFHGYMPDRRDDGSLNTVLPKTEWPDDYSPDSYPFERATTFAVPLAAVSDTNTLESRLVKPLLSALQESRRGSRA